MRKFVSAALGTLGTVGCMLALPQTASAANSILFSMVRSAAVENAGCALNANARVSINTLGPVEVMHVEANGLPPNQEFDLFVIQQANAPFGMAWYQGDIETNAKGIGHGKFVGRFNEETFIVSPAAVPAPFVHNEANPDATIGVKTGPVHTYHLGLWFNSPQDAVKAGCPGNVTPFNGEHNAGLQILNTSQFPDLAGPLLKVKP